MTGAAGPGPGPGAGGARMVASDPHLPDWIAVDWGTSNLRAYAMQGDQVLAEAQSAAGMAQLSPSAFEPALLDLIGPWLRGGAAAGQPLTATRPLPVLACGMVGARQGWVEAPYRKVPCVPVAPGALMSVATRDARIRVMIVPGLCQSVPADVMRGEETQIAGFLAEAPQFHGTLLLPGTHSKHVRIAAGQVTGFATFLTGELFALLLQRSVLRHSVAQDGDGPDGDGQDPGVQDGTALAAAFLAGVAAGRAGQGLAGLFGLRAEGLLSGLSPAAARARLSGLLIGAELQGLAPRVGGHAGEHAGEYVVIGSGGLAARYVTALAASGVTARARDGADLVRRGLAALRHAEAADTAENGRASL